MGEESIVSLEDLEGFGEDETLFVAAAQIKWITMPPAEREAFMTASTSSSTPKVRKTQLVKRTAAAVLVDLINAHASGTCNGSGADRHPHSSKSSEACLLPCKVLLKS